jgi:glycosyltransferase involved in cell wall biosynthesis
VPGNLRVAMTVEQCWHRVPGGTAAACVNMARALTARDDVGLVGVAARHRRPAPAPWRPPIDVRQLPLPRPALYESWHRLRRPSVERAVGPVDVIHATTMAVPPRSRPLVLTIHDLGFVRNPDHFTARGLRFFRRGLSLALRDADLVLCSSRATMHDCREAGFGPERLRHVPLGVTVGPVTRDAVERVLAHYGLHRPYVLWTGTIEPRKNLRALLRAFALVSDKAELVLAGPAGWKEDIQPLVREASRVHTLGFVPPDDLAALYGGARVFCWPSLLEGFGLPVLEAMAAGTPVVTSKDTSTEEIARGAGVVVDPRDVGAIASALDAVLSDDALAQRLSQAGRARAAEYTWQRCARLVADAYHEVAA